MMTSRTVRSRPSVQIGGRPIPVDPAWVVVAPPNYAPDLHGLRTMYDLLTDVYIQAGWLESPAAGVVHARRFPILRRLMRLQWVNQGFAAQFGWGAPNDFLTPEYLSRLASAGSELCRASPRDLQRISQDSTGTACRRFPGRGSTETR